MARFEMKKPISTTDPVVSVEVNPEEPLPPGTYTFELQVRDDSGNLSAPALARVTINDPGPTAIIDGPAEVPVGQPFNLSGERSSDIPPGKIVEYVWTLVDVEADQ